MSMTLGYKEIILRIVEGAPYGTSLVLPNTPANEGFPLPRYVIQEAGGAQATRGLDGWTEATAEVVVRVETSTGGFATQSNDLVEALVALFPASLRFGVSTDMTVLEAPNVRPPLPGEDGVYAVPVIVRARFSF